MFRFAQSVACDNGTESERTMKRSMKCQKHASNIDCMFVLPARAGYVMTVMLIPGHLGTPRQQKEKLYQIGS